MTILPFCGEECDGKIWGRGASATKGPMAAMLWALWELRDRLADLRGSMQGNDKLEELLRESVSDKDKLAKLRGEMGMGGSNE